MDKTFEKSIKSLQDYIDGLVEPSIFTEIPAYCSIKTTPKEFNVDYGKVTQAVTLICETLSKLNSKIANIKRLSQILASDSNSNMSFAQKKYFKNELINLEEVYKSHLAAYTSAREGIKVKADYYKSTAYLLGNQFMEY